MIQPISKLPWFADPVYDICADNQDEAVAIDLYKQDAEYLVLACNNFLKSIEFLKECRDFMNVMPNDREDVNHYEILKRVEEFLKEIEP